jgi:hypothetical protein
MSSFWDRPEAQDALAARHMDRVILNEERVRGDTEQDSADPFTRDSTGQAIGFLDDDPMQTEF